MHVPFLNKSRASEARSTRSQGAPFYLLKHTPYPPRACAFLKQIARSDSARALPHKARTHGAQSAPVYLLKHTPCPPHACAFFKTNRALVQRARSSTQSARRQLGVSVEHPLFTRKKSWDWSIYTSRAPCFSMILIRKCR